MSRSVVDWLNRPEYIYQPRKLLRRIFGERVGPGGMRVVKLPWLLPLEVDCSETIGRVISHHGIYEFAVVEAIFRLVDPTDNFLDVGANLGYMTSAAVAAGAKNVISFEPHPDLFARLSRNMSHWIAARPAAARRVAVRQAAISSKSGMAALRVPRAGFVGNQGLSTLESVSGQDAYDLIDVTTTTLDRVIDDIGEAVGVMKIDIEGHELQAFAGGGSHSDQARYAILSMRIFGEWIRMHRTFCAVLAIRFLG
jgi:FkbM family methyltransferase